MKLADALRMLVGSFAIFGVVATGQACASNAARFGTGGNDGGQGAGSGSSGGQAGHGGGIVANAKADESGTRLKANLVTSPDGAKHYIGTFHDAQRNETCFFTQLGDGSWRCLPTYASASGYYADSGCSKPVVVSYGCSSPARYVGEVTGCGLTGIKSVGAKFSGQLYAGGLGQCIAATTPAGALAYEVGSSVPLSSFASGTAIID